MGPYTEGQGLLCCALELRVRCSKRGGCKRSSRPCSAGPAEQTDSCPGGESRVAFRAFQHLYKTGLLHAEGPGGGEGRGGWAGRLPLPAPQAVAAPPAAPTLPGTGPARPHWDQRHLLGRGGMRLGASAGSTRQGPVSPPLPASVSSSVKWAERDVHPHSPLPPAADTAQREKVGRELGTFRP